MLTFGLDVDARGKTGSTESSPVSRHYQVALLIYGQPTAGNDR